MVALRGRIYQDIAIMKHVLRIIAVLQNRKSKTVNGRAGREYSSLIAVSATAPPSAIIEIQ